MTRPAVPHRLQGVHRDAIEAFNRASHSDALREMQICHPEELQPLDDSPGVRWVIPMAAVLGFVLTVIGAWKL